MSPTRSTSVDLQALVVLVYGLLYLPVFRHFGYRRRDLLIFVFCAPWTLVIAA